MLLLAAVSTNQQIDVEHSIDTQDPMKVKPYKIAKVGCFLFPKDISFGEQESLTNAHVGI